MKKEFKYGKVIAGDGSPERKELEIVDYVKANFVSDRIISVSKIEDGNYVIAVENLPATGREAQTTMYLTKESLVGLISTVIVYFGNKGEDINGMIEELISGSNIYCCSDDQYFIGTEPKE